MIQLNEENIQIKTPEYVSLQFQPAGLGSRSAAIIIDHIILSIASLLIFLLMMLVMEGQANLQIFGGGTTVPIAIGLILIFALNGGYFFIAEYFFGGRTIGKRLLGIRVIQDNGHSLTLLSSFIRNFLRLIDFLPVYYFIGMLMVFLHSKHKRIGDLVAGTIVVHERKVKRKIKKTPLSKEIEKRGLTKDNLVVEEWVFKTLEMKEWILVKAYSERLLQLSSAERTQLTKQMADLILPKIGLHIEGKTDYDLENMLLVVYLKLKDEWEYEL